MTNLQVLDGEKVNLLIGAKSSQFRFEKINILKNFYVTPPPQTSPIAGLLLPFVECVGETVKFVAARGAGSGGINTFG